MDGIGEFKIPVHDGKHLEYDILGKVFEHYDSFINLAHGKGQWVALVQILKINQ